MHLVVIIGLLSLGGPDPSALLADVDRAANRSKDATLTLRVEVSVRGADPLHRTLRAWQLGNRRMVKFIAPARLRGTGILVPRPGETYLYLPAYKRVRRVVGKEGGGSFMGTGFSINDLARVRFSEDYTPRLKSETGTHFELQLQPRDPTSHQHASIRLRVRRSDHLVDRIETLDAAGNRLRIIAATDFRTVGKYTLAHRIQIDEVKTGKRTVATITKAVFDTGLAAGDFTERQLQRAP